MEENNSALVRALVDLDNYKIPSISQLSNLEYLQLERDSDYQINSPNRFKKTQEKTDRISKEFAITTALSSLKKNEEKEKERYKFYYGDTPEKKPSPTHKFAKKSPKSPKGSPKNSPKQSSKISPSTKDNNDRKIKVKVLQKKYW